MTSWLSNVAKDGSLGGFFDLEILNGSGSETQTKLATGEIWNMKKKKSKKNEKYEKKQKSKKIYNMKYEKKGVLRLREYEIWKIQRTKNVTISGFFLANMKYENFFILAWNNENYILTLTRILLKNDERIQILESYS